MVMIFDDFDRGPPSKESQLSTAAQQGDTAKIRTLVDEGVDIDCWSGKALRNAADRGHLDTIAVLLECGANPDVALKAARSAQEAEAVKILSAVAEQQEQARLDREHDGFGREGDNVAVRKQFMDNGKSVVTKIFDFETHEVTTTVVRDGMQSMFVRNFRDMEEQGVIEKAYRAIRAQGANPPDWKSTRVEKQKAPGGLKIGG